MTRRASGIPSVKVGTTPSTEAESEAALNSPSSGLHSSMELVRPVVEGGAVAEVEVVMPDGLVIDAAPVFGEEVAGFGFAAEVGEGAAGFATVQPARPAYYTTVT